MIAEDTIQKIKPGAEVKVFSAGGARLPDKKGSASGVEGASSFRGVVIARKHGKEIGATFTVRSIIAGVGVEKVYPLHSPTIAKVDIISSPKKVHRAKLYFVREISGKKIRKKLGVSL